MANGSYHKNNTFDYSICHLDYFQSYSFDIYIQKAKHILFIYFRLDLLFFKLIPNYPNILYNFVHRIIYNY